MNEKIIHSLKCSEGYLSGEEISKLFNVSRAGVWKHIEELRHLGYDIVAVPHCGYKLVSVPDKLLPWEINFNLDSKLFGKNIIYKEKVASTMDEAFQLGVAGEPEGTLVCCEMQTKGRGRLGRSWVSPRGKGVYLSFIVRPDLSPVDVAKLTLLSALAVRDAIQAACGVETSIKWPNDILVNEKKVAGILTELSAEVDRVRFVVIGIGLNVNAAKGQLPECATSLKCITGKAVPRVMLVQELLRCFESWYLRMGQEGFQPVLESWKSCSTTLGKRVSVSDNTGMIEGEAVDLDNDGALLIRTDTGIVFKKIAGDVFQVQ